jgi:hypothetical protein
MSLRARDADCAAVGDRPPLAAHELVQRSVRHRDLGFVFLPTSFLWYTAVQNWNGGEWGVLQIVLLVIALSIDVSPAGGRRR